MRYTDVAIVGGGLAGSTAAAMLGHAGVSALLIDPHTVYPPELRCEKLGGEQLDLLRKTGLEIERGRSVFLCVHNEPPRDCRRLQLLRRWSHDKQDDEQILSGSPDPCGADGSGPRGRPCIALGDGCFDLGEDRMYATDIA